MKNILSSIKFWLISWLTILFTLLLAWSIFASWTNISWLKSNSWEILNSNNWNSLLDNMDLLRNSQTIPAWWVIAFALNECPSWWRAADWRDINTPDLRGIFIRWANNFWTWENNRDLDRLNSWSWILTYQWDAIRNIEWALGHVERTVRDISWAFKQWNNMFWVRSPNYWVSTWIYFDASRVVPTWADNHPKNIALIYCIKD